MVCVGLQCSDMTSRGKFWGAKQNFGGQWPLWHPLSSAPAQILKMIFLILDYGSCILYLLAALLVITFPSFCLFTFA